MSYPGHSLGGVLPLCREAVSVFYSPSRLGNWSSGYCHYFITNSTITLIVLIIIFIVLIIIFIVLIIIFQLMHSASTLDLFQILKWNIVIYIQVYLITVFIFVVLNVIFSHCLKCILFTVILPNKLFLMLLINLIQNPTHLRNTDSKYMWSHLFIQLDKRFFRFPTQTELTWSHFIVG